MKSNAYSTIRMKTGAGRNTAAKPRAKHVEDAECQGLPLGTHELTNRGGATLCKWCGGTWAALDAELRERHGLILRPTKRGAA